MSTPTPGLTSAQILGIMLVALAVLLGIALLFKLTVDDPLHDAQATAVAAATSAREANAVLATAAVDARGLDVAAARATAEGAGERVAAAQATLALLREQATETASAADKADDRSAQVALATRPVVGAATPRAPSTGGGSSGAASGPLLTLISPASDEFATGCVFFAWSAPPPDVDTAGRYELRLCSERLGATSCEPSHTVRTTQGTSDAWQPDKPDELAAGRGIWDGGPQTFRWRVRLSDRPDVESAVGVFRWRPGTAPCRVK